MTFRLLDANGDWVFGAGTASLAEGNEAVKLDIRTRLLSWVNNCFFDLQAGIDWPTRLGRNQEQALLADLQQVILQTAGVISISLLSANLNRETRRSDITYSASTIYSTTVTDVIEAAIGLAS